MGMARDKVPTSDPEAEGLPSTADPDSVAEPRPDESGDLPLLPGDSPRDFAADAREDKTLSQRLLEEEPDVDSSPPDPPEEEVGRTGGFTEAGEAAVAETFSDVDDVPITSDEVSQPPVEPHLDSPVSLYDDAAPEEIGRIVAPNQGGLSDREKDEIATDVGPAGGGLSMEEQAMHDEEPE
jgi:hypothetical protein